MTNKIYTKLRRFKQEEKRRKTGADPGGGGAWGVHARSQSGFNFFSFFLMLISASLFSVKKTQTNLDARTECLLKSQQKAHQLSQMFTTRGGSGEGLGLGLKLTPPQKKKKRKERGSKRRSNVKVKFFFHRFHIYPLKCLHVRPAFPGQVTSTLTGLITIFITLGLGCWYDQYQLESRCALVTCIH